MIKFLLFPFRYFTSIICDRHPPSFLKPKVASWSNLQHKQICTSFINEALVFEMRKLREGGDRKCVQISINNMLWLALMSIIQNKYLPMPERRQYAVRHIQCLCQFVSQIIPERIFSSFFFTTSGFEKDSNCGPF